MLEFGIDYQLVANMLNREDKTHGPPENREVNLTKTGQLVGFKDWNQKPTPKSLSEGYWAYKKFGIAFWKLHSGRTVWLGTMLVTTVTVYSRVPVPAR